MTTGVLIVGGGGNVSGTILGHLTRVPAFQNGDTPIYLYDVDAAKVERNIALARAVAARSGATLDLRRTENLGSAARDVALIALGHRAENAGGGIFANVGLAQEIMSGVAVAPRTGVLVYANPPDLIAAVLSRDLPEHRIYGICTGPEEFRQNIGRLLRLPPDALSVDYVGTNHHGFVLDITLGGDSLLDRLKRIAPHIRADQHRGLRRGDEYDLVANLELFAASGVLTIPLGHDPYLHGSQDFTAAAKKARWRPGRDDLERIVREPQMPEGEMWSLLDSWGGRAVARALSALVSGTRSRLDLQAPNRGLLSRLDDHVYVERPVHVAELEISNIPLQIPPDIALHVSHRALYLDSLAEGLHRKSEEIVTRALIWGGQTRNFKYSLPRIRQSLARLWDGAPPAPALFAETGNAELDRQIQDTRDFDFQFV